MADIEEIAEGRSQNGSQDTALIKDQNQGISGDGNVVWAADAFLGKPGRSQDIVSFNRRELDQILRVYGFKVAAGEWRDYAIDMLRDRAIFSVFRRTSEVPLHCIEKNPRLSRRQGMWSVTGADGRILKRGHDLEAVLRIFDRKPKPGPA